MSNRIKNNLKNLVGQTLNQYYSKVKPTISDLRYKQEYQNRIIECMVGEVDDNYITTPETDSAIVKLEHSKEGLVKVPSIKGKTILVDADGNETDTPGEGCRLVSVGEEEDNKLIILSNNKNLFNPNCSITDNVYIDNNGIISPMSGYAVTNEYIKVKPSTDYICENSNHVGFYDINKNFINRGATWNSQSFTTPSNCHYIRFQIEWIGLENRNLNLHRFAEGSSINRFEIPPYQYHKTEILLDEPLRSLPNGVCDEIVGNQLIRRVGKVVLNGSENWCLHKQEEPNGLTAFRVSDIANSPENNSFVRGLSNLLPFYNWGSNPWTIKHSSIAIDGYNTIYMYTIPNDNLQDFKQRLSENPIELLYELAEPTIIEMPNTLTLQGFDDTTMYIENEITPTVQYGYNALIPYKEELLTQKEEVETNTLDIENNIIPYLMDMEFNLMLMEDE